MSIVSRRAIGICLAVRVFVYTYPYTLWPPGVGHRKQLQGQRVVSIVSGRAIGVHLAVSGRLRRRKRRAAMGGSAVSVATGGQHDRWT